MKDHQTEGNVKVSTDGTAGPYICVGVGQSSEVKRLLDANDIGYSSRDDAVRLDGVPAAVALNLGNGADVDAIQKLLDEN